jgi:hypothetical protein
MLAWQVDVHVAYCELQVERSTETRFPFEAGIGPELSFDRGTDIRFLIRTAYADTPAMFICSNFPHYVVFFESSSRLDSSAQCPFVLRLATQLYI